MTRRLVFAVLVLQVALLAMAQDETTTETAATTSVEPTRAILKTSTKPPVVHNALNASEAIANTTRKVEKNAASRVTQHFVIVAGLVMIAASAI
ncbi:hypothetical protein TcasGA2_TC009307 [Tribolium castaneum]|uniref:RxLR effector protein n=1 Tax=Tribolium castaneum TaxID=7070 RepID=D6WRW6_TRICA|nr:hypothetical protein TcasGA2_TC009307 [Tribolium castaneum]